MRLKRLYMNFLEVVLFLGVVLFLEIILFLEIVFVLGFSLKANW